MNAYIKWAAKAATLWVVLVIAGMAAGMLFHWDVPAAKPEPFDALTASLVVAGIGAAVMALLAERSLLRGWRLGLVMAVILFSVESGLSMIEAAAFNADLKIPASTLLYGPIAAAIRDAAGGLVIALMWRGDAVEAPLAFHGLWWKPPVIAILYIVAYFAAGILIAMQSPAVRAFYAHIPQISGQFVLTLQFCRGLIWCGLAFMIIRNLRGPAWEKATLTGLTFAALMVSQLLQPNPFMPWAIRTVHMVEIGVSNSIFGIVAALVLQAGAKRAPDTSAR